MAHLKFASVNVGDELVKLETEPVARRTLALYAGASGDHNPMHIDIDFAKAAGESDVFAHGMLVMAYMGRALTSVAPQSAIRSFTTQFKAITRVGDQITVTGKVADKTEEGGEKRIRIELTASDQTGGVKAQGNAVVALG